MGTERQLTDKEIEAFRKELADIKADMMRKELEEIKKERMRKELDEIKRERSAGGTTAQRIPYVPGPTKPALSLPNLIAAAVMLLIAGYLVGAIYGTDVAGSVNDLLSQFSLPAMGTEVVAVLAVLLAAFGIALMVIVKR